MKKAFYILAGAAAVCLFFLAGSFLGSVPGDAQKPEYDHAMQTENYSVQIEVLEDGSYQVKEQIRVNMLEDRHGIYRYIPRYGQSVYNDAGGRQRKIPFFGKIKLLKASAPAEVSNEDGCTVFRLGSEDETVYGPVEYTIRYRFTPYFQEKNYSNAYYNLFPNMWQNPIPAGSSFSVKFPKDFDHESLKLYGGSYGERKDASQALRLSWSGNTLEGTLQEDLLLGEGITFFAAMPEGYFTGIHALTWPKFALFALSLAAFVGALLLFLAFGRDETIYPSIQFQPPRGIDSAAVGYIIDGAAEDRDVLSLILYWADQGFLTIEEKEKDRLILHRAQPLPPDAPGYAQTLFGDLFKEGDACDVKKRSGKFYNSITAAKAQVKMCFQKENALYTKGSLVARTATGFLCALPFGGFMLLIGLTSYMDALWMIISVICYGLFLAGAWTFCRGVDFWHSKSDSSRVQTVAAGLIMIGLGLAGYGGGYLQRARRSEAFSYIILFGVVCAASAGLALLTAFMRRRTHRCAQWMGELLGLRDFIETAELDRLQALAEETPGVFYHILPYAYVMGLSEVFARKLKGLALAPPQWYAGPYDQPGGAFDYYVFHHHLMRDMDTATKALAVPEPPKSSDSGGGGGFSGGGGGFSGGGFGGGGGGSW